MEFLRDNAAEADEERLADDTLFQAGRRMAYVEVLLHMLSSAEIYEVPLDTIDLDNFDPLKDPLRRPWVAPKTVG